MSLMQYGALFIPVMPGLPCICCHYVPLVSTSIAWEKWKDRNGRHRHWRPDELQGKVGKCFLSDGKVGPCGFGKNHPRRRLRYFSRKPCFSGSIRRPAPVVQRAAKARVFTLNNKDYATSDHHKTTVTGPDRDARGKKTESAHSAAGNQAAAKRKRSGTYLQTAEPDTGNMQPSRQGQAAGGVLQGRLKTLSNHLILKLCFLHSSTN